MIFPFQFKLHIWPPYCYSVKPERLCRTTDVLVSVQLSVSGFLGRPKRILRCLNASETDPRGRSGRPVRSGRRLREPHLLLDCRPVRVSDRVERVQLALRALLLCPDLCADSLVLAPSPPAPPRLLRSLQRVTDSPAARVDVG